MKHGNELLYLSVAGSASALKSLRAVLAQKDIKFFLHFEDYASPFYSRYWLKRDKDGYASRSFPLGLGTHHMVLTSRRVGFMPALSHEAVWQEISGTRFTTPLLRSWLPWLYGKLTEESKWDYDAKRYTPKGFADIDCWGCKPGLLIADDGRLDSLVTTGIRSGDLKI